MALKTTPDKNNTKQKQETKEEQEKKQTEVINEFVIKKVKPTKTKYNEPRQKSEQINPRYAMNSTVLPPIKTSICPGYPSYPTLTYSPLFPITSSISPYIPISYSSLNYSTAAWTSIFTMQVQNPLYTIPALPISPLLTQSIPIVCPYTAMLTPPIVAEPWQPAVPTTVPLDFRYESIPTTNSIFYINDVPVANEEELTSLNPESYLLLPKELFPRAKMLTLVDPNLIIDQLCREIDIPGHSSWILDIEFGVPRTPVTRPVATYDINYNSIHCKNTPGAIHPEFETCSQDFKMVILFYYDSVISTWYNSFKMIHFDGSVANFQSWLQPPMQLFGLCWP